MFTVHSQESKLSHESQQERRQRIIDQALVLVMKNGLDNVAISDIAKACQLGPGQIYRCFKDKDEIIQNLIKRIADKRVKNSDLHSQNMIESISYDLAQGYPHQIEKSELYLLYEILNLDRNQKNSKLVDQAEKELMYKGLDILKNRYPQASESEIRAIAEVIATISDGTILRTAKGYSNNVDKKILEKFYLTLLRTFDSMFKSPDE